MTLIQRFERALKAHSARSIEFYKAARAFAAAEDLTGDVYDAVERAARRFVNAERGRRVMHFRVYGYKPWERVR